MTELLERLADANPVHTNNLAPSIEDVWRKLDPAAMPQRSSGRRTRVPKDVRSRRVAARWATVGAAAIAAAVALLVVGTTGGGPASAFAGWSATATPPASGQIQSAESACTERASLPVSLVPTLVDTRGPTALLVYVNGTNDGPVATMCVSGVPAFGTVFDSAEASVAVAAGAMRISTEGISLAADGQNFGHVDGQVGAGVTAVNLVLTDGSRVEATTTNGWFAAWWPGSQSVESAGITTASGTSIQAVTPINPPAVGATAATTATGATGVSAPTPTN